MIDLDKLAKQAKEHHKLHKTTLLKAPKNAVLQQLPSLHEEAFSKIDCLDCANCCRNYSPRFKMPDIKRIAKRLKMKVPTFIDTYLVLDTDGDYVVKSLPCPFLQLEDNKCSIYEDRPRDCYRYPYTDEDVLIKQVSLTLKNASICPAVFYVLEKLVKQFK